MSANEGFNVYYEILQYMKKYVNLSFIYKFK